MRKLIVVRKGKGNKDRIVPTGARALSWIAAYRDEARPQLVCGADDGTLFLTSKLENGADIRFIQAMLSHESLDTTRIYAQVGVAKLAAVHAATHPGASLKRDALATLRCTLGYGCVFTSMAASH